MANHIFQIINDTLLGFWAVLAEMSLWLLIGFAMAGVLWVFVKPAWVARHLSGHGGRGRGAWAVVKASLMGVPLPLCSCGVIPVGTSLHKQGASKGASASFLISTPQTGVDSILATYGLLGPVFAVVRPVVALLSGVLGGWLVDWVDQRETQAEVVAPNAQDANAMAGCAASSCCDAGPVASDASWWEKAKAAARYGFVTLPADLVVSLFFGLFLAAALTSAFGSESFTAWFGGTWGVLAAVVIGIPIYVCSTGSIPIAVALLAVGASPGAALAFLIAGPATNAATIAVVGGALGRRVMVVYVAAVLGSAVLAGFALNAIAGSIDLRLPADAMQMHEHGLTWLDHALAAALMLLMVVGWGTRRGRWFRASPDSSNPLLGNTSVTQTRQEIELPVEGMNCSHCTGSVETALRAVPGVEAVRVDLPGKRATVAGVHLDRGALAAAVRGAGFAVPG